MPCNLFIRKLIAAQIGRGGAFPKRAMANVSIPLPRNGLFVQKFPPKFHTFTTTRIQTAIRISCSGERSEKKEKLLNFNDVKGVACGILAAWAVTAALPVLSANQRLPPLSTEPNRCERAFIGNTIGQANGVYKKPLDLRFCDFTNEKNNLKRKSLSAALVSDAKFDGADMTEVVMSKAYAVGASFEGVDFSNAVLDRVNFENADLQGAVFKNTILSGSTFDEAKLEDAVFEDTIIGYIDLQKLCTNKSISDEGRIELGCR